VKLKIDRETTVCISIAKKPSPLGCAIFNSVFEYEKMNWIYKPFAVDSDGLEGAIAGIRALGIRGCGVSMPHKVSILTYLDEIEPAAKEIGAVNTVVNREGKLSGYNTDYIGCVRAVEEIVGDVSDKSALIYGAGGASRAIIYGLRSLGVKKIYVNGRTESTAREVCSKFGCEFVDDLNVGDVDANMFYNATPVGIAPEYEVMPFDEKFVSKFEIIGDVIVNPIESKLIRTARKLGKIAIPGYVMSMHQALEQFRLYTTKSADKRFVENKIKEIVSGN